jgi:hypothetical protein
MGTKTFATGADITLKLAFEATLGTLPASAKWWELPVVEGAAIKDMRQVGNSPLLGGGRNTQGVYPMPPEAMANFETRVDAARFGLIARAMMGVATSAVRGSHGYFQFSANPSNTQTIVINTVTWTFITGSSTGTQTQIKASLALTLAELATNLNASANASITPMTYTARPEMSRLEISHDTTTTAGDTIAISVGTAPAVASGATLSGGGTYQHTFVSTTDVGTFAVELGHAQLSTAEFRRYVGLLLDTVTVDISPSGAPVNAKITAPGLKLDSSTSSTVDASANTITLQELLSTACGIFAGGTAIGRITGGSITYSNNIDAPQTITVDGWKDTIATGLVGASGTITRLYSVADPMRILGESTAPATLVFRWEKPNSAYFVEWYFPRVFFALDRAEISTQKMLGANYAFIAEKDPTLGYTSQIVLRNAETTYEL